MWLDEQWRTERRARRVIELREWQQDYHRHLPPEPPCTSTDHGHDEIVTFGGVVIARFCEKEYA